MKYNNLTSKGSGKCTLPSYVALTMSTNALYKEGNKVQLTLAIKVNKTLTSYVGTTVATIPTEYRGKGFTMSDTTRKGVWCYISVTSAGTISLMPMEGTFASGDEIAINATWII